MKKKDKVGEKRSTVYIYADCLLTNTATKHHKYVVYQTNACGGGNLSFVIKQVASHSEISLQYPSLNFKHISENI